MRKELTKLVVFCFALLCLLSTLTVATLSRYRSNVSTNDTATIAIFQNDTYNVTLPLDDMSPGVEYEYKFAITNFQNTSVCEVTMQYVIQLSNLGHLPLQIVFIEASTSIPTTDTVANDIIIDDQNTTTWSIWSNNTLTGQTGRMAAAVATTHTYTVRIIWPEEYDDIRYKDEIDVVTLSVTATQVG